MKTCPIAWAKATKSWEWYRCSTCHKCFEFLEKIQAHICGQVTFKTSSKDSGIGTDEEPVGNTSVQIKEELKVVLSTEPESTVADIANTTFPSIVPKQEPRSPAVVPDQEESSTPIVPKQESPRNTEIVPKQKPSNALIVPKQEPLSPRGVPDQEAPNSPIIPKQETTSDTRIYTVELPSDLPESTDKSNSDLPLPEASDIQPAGKFSCYFCFKQIHYRHRLQHMLCHTKEWHNHCGCGHGFRDARELKRHKLSCFASHLNQNSTQCNKKNVCYFCNKSFKLISNLRMHMYLHTGEKYFQCATCKEEFRFPQQLRRHSCPA